MKRRTKPLQVTLDVREPSVVAFTVGETVQVDQLKVSEAGCLAERHGDLLAPGTTTIALEPGVFCFQTLADTQLQIVQGGVDVSADGRGGKDLPPPPMAGALPSTVAPMGRGDDAPGQQPRLTVTSCA